MLVKFSQAINSDAGNRKTMKINSLIEEKYG